MQTRIQPLIDSINEVATALDHPTSSTSPKGKALCWQHLRNSWLDNINSETTACLK